MSVTSFTNKCEILAELWLEYKSDPDFADFIQYNDLGLPLAYAIATDIVAVTPKAEVFISETFEVLLISLGKADTDFESLDELLDS